MVRPPSGWYVIPVRWEQQMISDLKSLLVEESMAAGIAVFSSNPSQTAPWRLQARDSIGTPAIRLCLRSYPVHHNAKDDERYEAGEIAKESHTKAQ